MSKFTLVCSVPLAALAAGAMLATAGLASADDLASADGDTTADAPTVPAPKIGYGTPIGGGMAPTVPEPTTERTITIKVPSPAYGVVDEVEPIPVYGCGGTKKPCIGFGTPIGGGM